MPLRALQDAESLDKFLKRTGVRAKRRLFFLEQYAADSSKFFECVRVAAHHVGRDSSPPKQPAARRLARLATRRSPLFPKKNKKCFASNIGGRSLYMVSE